MTINISKIIPEKNISNAITKIATEIANAGGKAFFVGGCTRDHFMGNHTKDIDITVESIEFDALDAILSKFGKTKSTGKEFLVIKITIEGQEFDFSIARDENSTGDSFKDFDIQAASLFKDLKRRDITINAIAIDCLTGEVVDPFGGIDDIKAGIIRHTSDKFAESSERPLRLMQILARNPHMRIHPDTIEVCKGMIGKFDSIPAEQIAAQFTKLFERGKRPGAGIAFLKDIGFIAKFPGLSALIGVPQSAKHHPEGDAFNHTLQVIDAMAMICDREGIDGTQRFKLVSTAACHDMGKPIVTKFDVIKGDITSAGHAHEVEAAKAFLGQIGVSNGMINPIIALINEHMMIMQRDMTVKSVRRIARRISDKTGDAKDIRKTATLNDLCLLFEADASGRNADGIARPIGQTGKIADFKAIAKSTNIDNGQKIASVITGKDLIAIGMKPSKRFGEILKAIADIEDNKQIGKAEALEIAKEMTGG